MRKINGTHLIVDAYVQDVKTLEEVNMLELFDSLVEELDMAYLERPRRVEVPLDEVKLETDDDDGGCSYYCLITTSHIAAHTWELRKAVMLDVFSCRPFDTDKAMGVINSKLAFNKFRKVVVQRMDPEDQVI